MIGRSPVIDSLTFNPHTIPLKIVVADDLPTSALDLLRAESGWKPSLSLIPFYDFGVGKNRNEGADIITSAGLALRIAWKGFRFDAAFAKRILYPAFVDIGKGNLQDHGIHLQLTYDLF